MVGGPLSWMDPNQGWRDPNQGWGGPNWGWRVSYSKTGASIKGSLAVNKNDSAYLAAVWAVEGILVAILERESQAISKAGHL